MIYIILQIIYDNIADGENKLTIFKSLKIKNYAENIY